MGNFGQRRARPKRATYSNTGAVVDLSAPGGEQVEDMDGDGFPDGVLSTVKDFVTYYQGTSMAAPHVAGVAMLLKSLAPAMDQDEVRALLTTTADPNIDCEGCGAGMVNAAKAIVGWNGGLDAPYVVTSPAVARLGRMDLDAEVRVKNISDVDSVLNIYIGGADRDAVTISKEQLNLVPSGEETIAVSVNRSGTDRGSAHLLLVYEDGRTHQVELVWTDAYLNQAGAATVGALRLEEDGSFSVARMVVATALTEYNYHLFNLPAGDYVILGLTDDDDDGELEDHEGVGVYPPLKPGKPFQSRRVNLWIMLIFQSRLASILRRIRWVRQATACWATLVRRTTIVRPTCIANVFSRAVTARFLVRKGSLAQKTANVFV